MNLKFTVRYLLATVATVFFFQAACTSGGGGGLGGGCDCLAPIPGGIDPDQRLRRSIQARISSSGLRFIETNFGPIIESVLAGSGGLVFPVPQTSQSIGIGTATICPGGCNLRIDLTSPAFNAQEPDTLQVSLNLNAVVTQPSNGVIPITGIIGSTCNVRPNLGGGAGKPVRADIKFSLDPQTERLKFDIPNLGPIDNNGNISDQLLNSNDFSINCTGIIGGIINLLLPLLQDTLINTINDQFDIKAILSEQLAGLQAQACTQASDCPTKLIPSAACTTNPTCNGIALQGSYCTSASGCIPLPLGLEGQVDVGALLASIAPGLDSKLDLSVVAGGGAQPGVTDIQFSPVAQASGLMLNLWGGSNSTYNACVPQTQPPVNPATQIVDEVPWARAEQADLPGNKKISFMAGIGVTDSFVAKTIWDAFNGGLLCLSIGTETVAQLSTGTLGLLLPSLSKLAGGNQPVFLTLRPSEAPQVNIGESVYETKPDGTRVIKKPLIYVAFKNLYIDFYGFLYGRYTWLFALKTDIVLPVGLDAAVNSDGVLQLIPIIDLSDPTTLLQNLSAVPSDVLAESADVLVDALPTLINTALPLITGGSTGGALIPPIDLDLGSTLGGLGLDIKAISGVGSPARPSVGDCNIPAAQGPCYPYLGLFADLTFNPQAAPIREVPGATSTLVSKQIPDIAALRASTVVDGKLVGYVSPSVTFDFGSKNLTDKALEFSHRLDNGNWSLWSEARRVTVTDPRLWTTALHTLDVRARVKGDIRAQDIDPTTTVFAIDPIKPTVSAAIDSTGTLQVQASDNLTAATALRMAWSVNGGAFNEWRPLQSVSFAGSDAAKLAIDVKVADEEGNETVVRVSSALTGGAAGPGNDAYNGGNGGSAVGGEIPAIPADIAAAPSRGQQMLAEQEANGGSMGCSATREPSAAGASGFAGLFLALAALWLRGRKRG